MEEFYRFMKELPEALVPDDFYKQFLSIQKQRWQDSTARLVWAKMSFLPLYIDFSFIASSPGADLQDARPAQVLFSKYCPSWFPASLT